MTVLDVSAAAIAAAKARLGEAGWKVHWLVADATEWTLERPYDLWHDRAAFHFLVDPADRAAYVERLGKALRPGGHAILATFAPDGPENAAACPSCVTMARASPPRSAPPLRSSRHGGMITSRRQARRSDFSSASFAEF